jgi:uncharacterized protein (DUF2249 family)
MAVDPAFKLERKLRSRFADTLRKELNRNPSAKRRKKQASVMKLLDCTPPELVDHLEKQFTEGMSWDNWGKGKDCWNIDHIKPLASFDMLDEDDLKECWHYTNLQPLWEMENLQKHDSLDWDQTNLQ